MGIVRRVEVDGNRVKYLMHSQAVSMQELSNGTGMTYKSLYTSINRGLVMPEVLVQIADRLQCSVEYLQGKDDQIRKPNKQITCEHCGYCKTITDAGGKRRICAKWHIYRVQPDDHCSWGEWRTMKELIGYERT